MPYIGFTRCTLCSSVLTSRRDSAAEKQTPSQLSLVCFASVLVGCIGRLFQVSTVGGRAIRLGLKSRLRTDRIGCIARSRLWRGFPFLLGPFEPNIKLLIWLGCFCFFLLLYFFSFFLFLLIFSYFLFPPFLLIGQGITTLSLLIGTDMVTAHVVLVLYDVDNKLVLAPISVSSNKLICSPGYDARCSSSRRGRYTA